MQFRQMTGGFVVREIVTSAPTRLVATVEDQNNEQFATMIVVTESAAPYVIDRISLRAIATPAEFAPPAMSQSELLAALGSKVEAETSAGGFSGAVLVAKDGRPIFARAYGQADREHSIANTLETRFRIGSMNKMFTAVATLQLVAAGKINLDAPLGTYLPDYPNKDVTTHVTIAELLDHTGGTGDIFGRQFDAHRLELQTLQDYETVSYTHLDVYKRQMFMYQVQKGRLTQEEAWQRGQSITFTDDWSELAGADLVVEAVFEDLDVKREVFAKLDGIVKPEGLLASNTSTLDIDAMARCV